MPPNVAVVSHAGREWTLAEGQFLTYGREETRPIRIRDPRISSRAGLLMLSAGCVWVRHDSTSHGLTLVPRSGPSRTIHRRPGNTRFGLPEPLLGGSTSLRMIGRLQTVEIHVDASGLPGPSSPSSLEDDPSGDAATETIGAELTPGERRILAALGEPLLTGEGEGRVRRTREAAVRLGLTYRTLENRLGLLRLKLTELGVDGLLRDDLLRAEGPDANFVTLLGTLAVAHGWFDLSDLPDPEHH